MKKFLNATLAMIMVFAMFLGNTVTASATNSLVAASSPETAELVAVYSASYPYTSFSNSLAINTTYKRLAYCSTNGSGFNRNLKICCELNGISNRGVVQMRGKNGNILWTASSDEHLVPSHGSYTFWCGSDVYSIWIKTSTGFGTAWIER